MQKQQDYLLLLLLVHMQGSRSAKREDDEERKSKGRRRRKKKEIWRCFLLVSLRDMTVIRRCRLTYPIHLKRILLCLSCSSFQLMDKQKCCCYCVCVWWSIFFALYLINSAKNGVEYAPSDRYAVNWWRDLYFFLGLICIASTETELMAYLDCPNNLMSCFQAAIW